ncbi:MAG: hypothetical protein EBU76_11695, partial [Gammaproteobacteria bacterium]|nr:hypothetical protein [Gammaproteobacteria bacterium]
DLEGLKSRLFRLIPNQSIEVTPAQRSIVLSGTVPDATAMTTALKVAESYLTRAGGARRQAAGGTESGGEIINLLQVAGSQQVMVEVRVAEVARSELKRMNARFNAFGIRGNWSGGGVNGGALFPDARFSSSQLRIPSINSDGSSVVAPVLDEFAPNDISIANQGIFTSYFSDSFAFNLAIDARSQDFLKGNTELVILVTPRLARPVDPKRLELPTDRYREPTDWDFFMLGRLDSSGAKPAVTPAEK